MSNMGYCRFQNTLSDLKDCYDHMDDELSEEEQRAKDRMVKVCCDIALDYGAADEDDED